MSSKGKRPVQKEIKEKKSSKLLPALKFIMFLIFCVIIGTGVGTMIRYRGTVAFLMRPEVKAVPTWATDADVETDAYDNTSKVTFNDDKTITVTDVQGNSIVATVASVSEIRLLNRIYESGNYEYGWLNLHDGYHFSVYKFDTKDAEYVFYQHILYPDSVYVYKIPKIKSE